MSISLNSGTGSQRSYRPTYPGNRLSTTADYVDVRNDERGVGARGEEGLVRGLSSATLEVILGVPRDNGGHQWESMPTC